MGGSNRAVSDTYEGYCTLKGGIPDHELEELLDRHLASDTDNGKFPHLSGIRPPTKTGKNPKQYEGI